MAAERTFYHGGLRVDVYGKSFKWTGMPFTVRLWEGTADPDTRIRQMIDAAQKVAYAPPRPEFDRLEYEEKVIENMAGTRCPICMSGQLVKVGPEVWWCSRSRCNSEFFYDGEPGNRLLNCRDKRLANSPQSQPGGWLRRLFRARTCECPPPFIPQRNGTCGVCALPPKNDQG